MSDDNIIETHGRYRVRLEIQQNSYGYNPRTNQDCNLTNVITPTQRGYIDVDEDGGPLQYGWDYYSTRALDCIRRADAEDLFIRWARIFHGVTVIEDRPHDGAWSFWYVMPDKAKESTWPPEKIIEAEIKEYRAWAEGEVYAYVIEKSLTWVPKGGQEVNDFPGEMTTWHEEESCGGLIGREYAEEAAKEAFAPYKED
jgi:hypothetical protein